VFYAVADVGTDKKDSGITGVPEFLSSSAGIIQIRSWEFTLRPFYRPPPLGNF